MLDRIKTLYRGHRERLFIAIILILVASLSFGIGRLSVIYSGGGGIQVLSPMTELEMSTKDRVDSGGGYVASKTGTKYYAPWCKDVLNISAENKIYLASKEDAEVRGYVPAGNCKGI